MQPTLPGRETVAASVGVACDVIAPSLIPSSTRRLAREGQQRERRDVVTGLVDGEGQHVVLVGGASPVELGVGITVAGRALSGGAGPIAF